MKVLIFMVAVLIAAIEICAQVQTVDLGGHLAWKVFDANLNVSTFGTVPGCVHTDLLNAGLIDEPYYRYNQRQYLWIAESDWTYTRQFTLTSDFVALPALLLVTEGLDTVATVKINDVLVGQGENSHLRYEWDIKHAVQVGTNTIVVQFTSAVKYGAAQAAQYPYEVPYVQFPDQIDNRPFVRKAQSHFAWDWGPAFATMGIWRNISLVGFTDVWMSDIVVTTAPDAHTGDFTVNFSAYVRSIGNFQNALLNAIGASAENSCLQDITLQSSRIDCAMTVVQPPLWWPNGYGNPTLHDLIVELKVNGHVQSKKVRVGFRTFEVVEDPLPDGQTFYFKVNNVPIFIKGVNVVPADSFESRINPSTWGWLMDSARDSHMNMLRVWGGGIYQPDYFYDLCDEKGLMVWQEFLYACAMYPRNTAFLQTVTAETVYNAKRLSYHASLMLWGGNNENEVGFGWYAPTKATPTLYAIDYDILYVQTVRAALLSVDNSRAFRTSSPTAGTFTNDPYVTRWGQVGNFYGDVHYYNGVDKVTDVTKIPKPRFASEYGFQSYPSVYTLAPVTVPSDLQWNSPLMVFRQHSPPSQTQVANQLAMLFRVPPDSDYKSFYYLSQCVQAEGYKTTITLWRRQKAQAAHTMGVMYWQLNDIWQAPTWASIQYDGRWKMLQNYIQRIYAPVIVSAYNLNDQHVYVEVTSDLTQSTAASVNLTVINWQGAVTWTDVINTTVNALDSKQIFTAPYSQICSSVSDCVLLMQLNGDPFGEVFYFTDLKNVNLPKPNIVVVASSQVDANTVSITLQSDAVAPYVFLETPTVGRWTENGFLMKPHVSYQLQFFAPNGVQVQQLVHSLDINTVRFTYQ